MCVCEHVYNHLPRPSGLVTVYLMDSVTGGIVYHTTHRNAHGPVQLVHSENWVIVSGTHTVKQYRLVVTHGACSCTIVADFTVLKAYRCRCYTIAYGMT